MNNKNLFDPYRSTLDEDGFYFTQFLSCWFCLKKLNYTIFKNQYCLEFLIRRKNSSQNDDQLIFSILSLCQKFLQNEIDASSKIKINKENETIKVIINNKVNTLSLTRKFAFKIQEFVNYF